MNKQKQRFRNHGLWVSIIAKIILIVQLGAVLLGYEIPQEIISKISILLVDGILGIFVLLGIISNPTRPNKKGFNL